MSRQYICRKAPCRAYLDWLSFCCKIGDAMCIPEMSFFLVAVKDGNGTMRFCGVLWPIVCFIVAHCNLFHTSIVMQNITMSRGCSICELSLGRRFEFLGDREGRPIRINRRTSPSTSVGARAADVGLGGPLGSPASCSSGFHVGGTRVLPNPTLAPTDRSAS